MGKIIYEIMHADRKVASVDKQGRCTIYEDKFMPYHLYLEETESDIDTLVNNITNFYYWCATRVLTLDRQYAKNFEQYWDVTGCNRQRARSNCVILSLCVFHGCLLGENGNRGYYI